MATLTAGATVLDLMLVGYTSRSDTGNILHKVIGKTAPDVTFAEATLPSGKLIYLCEDHAEALAAEAMHRATGSIVLTDATLPTLGMTYVPSGSIEVEMDDTTQEQWTCTVEFQAIA